MKPTLGKPIGVTLMQQLDFLEAAPSLPIALQWRKAQVLSLLDRFDEALALCETLHDPDQTPERELLHAAMLCAQTPARDLQRAERILRDLLGRKLTPATRASALASLAELAHQRHDLAEARDWLAAALAIEPLLPQALRKYAVIEASEGQFDTLVSHCESLAAMDTVNPLLTAIHATALAAAGRVDEAKRMRRFDELFWAGTPPVPTGFDGIADFNRELAAELRAHPALRYENSRRASEASWRIDELLVAGSTHIRTLLEAICTGVESYVRDVVDDPSRSPDSPFDRYRPRQAKITQWAVLTGPGGFERWHVHGKGWISGVYYIAVPRGLPEGGATPGAIDFGWWEDMLGEGASERLGQRRVHPEPGMLLLFPSHIHHRTWPHATEQERICVAFDIVPQ